MLSVVTSQIQGSPYWCQKQKLDLSPSLAFSFVYSFTQRRANTGILPSSHLLRSCDGPMGSQQTAQRLGSPVLLHWAAGPYSWRLEIRVACSTQSSWKERWGSRLVMWMVKKVTCQNYHLSWHRPLALTIGRAAGYSSQLQPTREKLLEPEWEALGSGARGTLLCAVVAFVGRGLLDSNDPEALRPHWKFT